MYVTLSPLKSMPLRAYNTRTLVRIYSMGKARAPAVYMHIHDTFSTKSVPNTHTYTRTERSERRISTKKAHQPKSSLSQSLRMEFSSSVCFIENGAGRTRNHFHRIRIHSSEFSTPANEGTKKDNQTKLNWTNLHRIERKKTTKSSYRLCVCAVLSFERLSLSFFYVLLVFKFILFTFLVVISI